MEKPRIAVYIDKFPLCKFSIGDDFIQLNSKNTLKISEKYGNEFIGHLVKTLFEPLKNYEGGDKNV